MKNKDWKPTFFTIWTGQAFSLLGSSLVQFALVWYLTKTTGSATVLATATLMAMLPGVLLAPFAGALVDRWNRRWVMVVADSAVAFATLVLIYFFWAGVVQPWHIYLIAFFRSLGGTFHYAAMSASTSLMVPKEHMARISGLNSALGGTMNIVAPPLGALLMSALPMYSLLSIDIVTAMLAVAPLLFIPVPQPPPLAAPEKGENMVTTMLKDFRAGLHYVGSWTGLLLVLVMATLINFLLNPAFSLMPLLVTKHFGSGVGQLAGMESAMGVGVIAGGLGLSVWGGFKKKMYTSLTGVVGIGVGVLLMGIAPGNWIWVGFVGILLAGLANPIANGPLLALVQTTVAPEMQGRVMTLIGSLAGAMSPISMLVAGPVSDAVGIQAWYILGGLACIFMGIGASFVPAIRHLEDEKSSSSGVETAVTPAVAD